MPSFSGKFQYSGPDGGESQSGLCQVSFDAETLTLTPQGGTPLALDLGNIDLFAPGEYELTLTLYTGKKIVLHQFGKTFQNLTHDLLEAYRARLVQCLLLEDLEELARFEGIAQLESPERAMSSPAEFRLYKSNLAILPTAATGFQWRLADISSVRFDEERYSIAIEAMGEKLIITKLAKRTREFVERLHESTTQLTEKAANTIHQLFPFLTPDQFQRAARLMKEGHVAPLARLNAIHSRMGEALVDSVVDSKLQPYFEALMRHVPGGNVYAGFKLIRNEKGERASPAEAAAETEQKPQSAESGAIAQELRSLTSELQKNQESRSNREEEHSSLHWFFFPLAGTPGAAQTDHLVAWEATSAAGRATYFFRLLPREQAGALADPAKAADAVEAAIQKLNRALVLLNFRREPIYLSDDKLETQQQYRRYAIACRKLPELRRLRASFVGRAIHTSPTAWQEQVMSFLTPIK